MYINFLNNKVLCAGSGATPSVVITGATPSAVIIAPNSQARAAIANKLYMLQSKGGKLLTNDVYHCKSDDETRSIPTRDRVLVIGRSPEFSEPAVALTPHTRCCQRLVLQHRLYNRESV